jgi:peptidoglycan hydrolase CwlO-like protein
MRSDEELDQLRAENKALCERLQRKDEELEQSRQANQNLREGLKEAIKAIESLQGHVKTLEGLIDSKPRAHQNPGRATGQR